MGLNGKYHFTVWGRLSASQGGGVNIRTPIVTISQILNVKYDFNRNYMYTVSQKTRHYRPTFISYFAKC